MHRLPKKQRETPDAETISQGNLTRLDLATITSLTPVSFGALQTGHGKTLLRTQLGPLCLFSVGILQIPSLDGI